MPYQFEDLKKGCQSEWRAYIEHSFVRQLGDASLAPEAFQHYLKQDYLFLIQFARAFALAAYKSQTLSDLKQAKEGLQSILDVELDLHVALSPCMASWNSCRRKSAGLMKDWPMSLRPASSN